MLNYIDIQLPKVKAKAKDCEQEEHEEQLNEAAVQAGLKLLVFVRCFLVSVFSPASVLPVHQQHVGRQFVDDGERLARVDLQQSYVQRQLEPCLCCRTTGQRA